MNKLIIFYGLPCTGKTVLSQYFCKLLGGFHIDIEEVWKSEFIAPKYTVAESNIVFSKFFNIINEHMNAERNLIIVEGVFASIKRLNEIKMLSIKFSYALCSILLFDEKQNLINRNLIRNKDLTSPITEESIHFLMNKFDSQEFCDISINTGSISLPKTLSIIKLLV